MEQYFWNWGNFDYNKGYADGVLKVEKIVKEKDDEILRLEKKIKKIVEDNNIVL